MDVVPYWIRCHSEVNGQTQDLELYKKGDTFPSYRRITYHTKEDIKLRLEYSPESLDIMMPGSRPLIAETVVKATEKMKTAESGWVPDWERKVTCAGKRSSVCFA